MRYLQRDCLVTSTQVLNTLAGYPVAELGLTA
jgi:hypothetical protein